MAGDHVGSADIEIGADGGRFLGDLETILQAAQRMGEKQGQKLADALNKPLNKAGSRGGKMFQLIAAGLPFLTSGISALSGAAVGLGGSLMNTVVSGAALLPIIGGLGGGMLATIFASKGLKDALGGNSKALKKLAPDARAVVKEVLGMKDGFASLQKDVQSAVFANLSGTVARLGQNLLPVLRTGLVGAGTAVNGIVKSLGGFLASAQGVQLLGTAFSNNNRILTQLGTVATPILHGILVIYNALFPAAERLTGVIVRGGKAFDAWATGVTKSGQLAAFMDKAQNSAGRVWAVLKNVGLALFNVLNIGSGQGDSFLAVLERITGKFLAFTNSAKGKSQIAEWVTKGMNALQQLGQVVGSLGPLFAEMAKPDLIKSLIAVLQAAVPVALALAPTINAIVKAMADLLAKTAPVLGPLLAIAGAFRALFAVAKVITFILRFTGLLRAMQVILFNLRIAWALVWAAGLGPIAIVIAAIVAVVAIFVILWKKSDTFRNFWIGLWNSILAAAQAVGTWFTGTLVPWFAGVWSAITGGLSSFWSGVVNTFNSVVAAISGFISGAVATVSGFVSSVVAAVGGFLTWMIGWGLRVVDALTYPWRIGIALVIGVILVLWNAVYPIISAGVAAVVGFFTGLWNQTVAVFEAMRANIVIAFSAVMAFVMPIVQAIVNGVSAAWSWLVGVVTAYVNGIRSIVVAVWGAISGFVSGAMNTIRGVVSSVWAAVTGFVSANVNAVRSLVSAGFNALVGLVSGPLATLRSIVSGAFNAVVSYVSGAIGRARAAASQLISSVVGAIRGGISQLTTIGSQIVSGLISGITGMAGTLRSAVMNFINNNVPAPIRKLLHIASPSKLMQEIGSFIGQGLAKGITGSGQQVKDAMAHLSGLIAKAKIPGTGDDRAIALLRSATGKLVTLANLRASVADKLKAAQQKLVDALKTRNDFAESVRSSLTSYGTIIYQTAQTAKALTADDVLKSMQDRLTAMKTFYANLLTLQKMGLNKVGYEQIVAGGVDQAGATAAALVAGGQAAVSQANNLQKQLNGLANTVGVVASQNLYQAGVDAASGLVKGLTTQSQALAKAATTLANNLVKAVKKALGIKSPSRVMADIAHMSVKGMTNTFDASAARVAKSGAALGQAAADGFASSLGPSTGPLVPPSLSGNAAKAGWNGVNPAPGGDTFEVTLALSVEDLKDFSTLADFLAMLKNSRVQARKTARSGTVTS